MARPYDRMIGLILAAVVVAACAPTPTPTPRLTAVASMPTAPPAAPTSPPPTAAPTAMPPTLTATVAAPTSPPPTVVPTAVPPTPTALPAALPSPRPADGGTPMPTSQPPTGETRIRVIIGDTVLTGRLRDNATARDLIAQLPLTLSFSDYGGQEKHAPLPRKLSMNGVPPGDDPLPRDITYYAPAGVVVFLYKDIGYFTGIVRIGQFDGDMDAITDLTGNFAARIELAH